MTYSVYNIKVDNKLTFTPGPTAGWVLSINADGSTSWVEAQGGGGGGGLTVDFTGLPSEVFLAEEVSLTASTPRAFATYDIGTQLPPAGVIYPVSRYNIFEADPNNYSNFWFSNIGTQSVTFVQGDIAGQSGGLITKEVLVKERVNPLYVYTGGSRTTNVVNNSGNITTTVKYDDFSEGRNIWQVNHNNDVYGIAVDSSGNVYTGGFLASNLTTRKYNSSGNLLWSVNHATTVWSIAVDSSGNVYTGGARTSNLTTRKYDSSGNLLWSVNHGDDARGIAVDSSGNVYTGGDRTSSLTTRKYDSSGTLLWSVDHGAQVNGIAVDSSGNVYTGGLRASNLSTRKYDSSGNVIWSVDHASTVNAIAVDSSGNVYTAGFLVSVTTRKYDIDGNLIWSRNHGGTTRTIAVDKSGNVYTGGNPGFGVTTRKYNSSGDLIWSLNYGEGSFFTGIVHSIATFPANVGGFLS